MAELHPIVQAAAHAIAGHLSVQCPGQVLRSGPDPACAGCRKAAASLAGVAAPVVLTAAAQELRAIAERLRIKAAESGDKTHRATSAGLSLGAFRLTELADKIAGGSQGGDTDPEGVDLGGGSL